MTANPMATATLFGVGFVLIVPIIPVVGGYVADARREQTGPLLLQGDHGIVAFLNIRIRLSGVKTTQSRG